MAGLKVHPGHGEGIHGMGNAIDGGTKFRSVTQQRANGLVDIRERASIECELIGGNGGGRVNVVDEELRPRGLATRSVEGAANKNKFIGPIFSDCGVLRLPVRRCPNPVPSLVPCSLHSLPVLNCLLRC